MCGKHVASKAVPDFVHRDRSFSEITDAYLKYFKAILGEAGVITSDEELGKLNEDWTQQYRGNGKVALMPTTTEQVSSILRYCNARRIAVVPQGGKTGLVGGSTPIFDEIILLTVGLKKIISFDDLSGILVCEAGMTVQELDEFLLPQGFVMPYDLGPRKKSQVGGNISTNAGGHRMVRYGSLHGNVLGLEVVMADGTVLDSLSSLRKDNTGYDLKQLFIGAEGTLGVITKMSMLVARKPKVKNTCFLGLKDFDHVLETLAKARTDLGEILSAIEFLDRPALDLVLKHFPQDKHPESFNPLSKKYDQYMVVESHGSNPAHDREKMTDFVQSTLSAGLAEEGVVAESDEQATQMWLIRLRISRSLLYNGAVYKYDISLPVRSIYKCSEDLQRILGSRALVVSFGHLGDGNLHLNISSPQYDLNLKNEIEDFVYKRCAEESGSISAEHGLGVLKAHKIHYSKSEGMVNMMRKIKQLFDPNGILNPYKTVTISKL